MSNYPTASTQLRVFLLTALFSFILIPLFTPLDLQAQGLVAQAPTATSVTLHWTAPGDDSTSGTAAQYDIRYSTSPITLANWDSATQVTGEPSPQVAGSAESFTVNGLNPSTTYYFAIRAADEVPNWSGLSNVISVQTNDNEPPAAISDLNTGS